MHAVCAGQPGSAAFGSQSFANGCPKAAPLATSQLPSQPEIICGAPATVGP